MDLTMTILTAAKAAKVSGSLLLAVCSHESGGFTMNYAAHDHGSPSIGSCQIKYKTAQMLGFHGVPDDLMNPAVNAMWAAKYLAYQQDRYGENSWIKLTASYNAGSYVESKKVPGCPRNLAYVKKVQAYLEPGLQDRLSCGVQVQFYAQSKEWH